MPKFRTTLLEAGKTAVGMVVPPEIVEGLGAGKRPPVRITINSYSYRNTVAVMGGKFMVGVSAEHRAGAHVKGGDEVEVGIELDTAPREVTVPADFAKALAATPGQNWLSTNCRSATGSATCCRWKAPGTPRPAPGVLPRRSRRCATRAVEGKTLTKA